MAKGQLDIELLGTSFAIQANESVEYLDSIYEYYKDMVKKVEETVGNQDPLKVAIISGILITDELKKERIRIAQMPTDERDKIEITMSTKRIIDKIDDIINNEDLD